MDWNALMYHGHKGLAYMIFFAALVNVVLALSVSKKPATLALVIRWIHNLLILWVGRVNILIGFAFCTVKGGFQEPFLGNWWVWLSLLCWGPMEVLSKRIVKPELSYAIDGVTPGRKLFIGLICELVCIAAIFGMMSAR